MYTASASFMQHRQSASAIQGLGGEEEEASVCGADSMKERSKGKNYRQSLLLPDVGAGERGGGACSGARPGLMHTNAG